MYEKCRNLLNQMKKSLDSLMGSEMPMVHVPNINSEGKRRSHCCLLLLQGGTENFARNDALKSLQTWLYKFSESFSRREIYMEFCICIGSGYFFAFYFYCPFKVPDRSDIIFNICTHTSKKKIGSFYKSYECKNTRLQHRHKCHSSPLIL